MQTVYVDILIVTNFIIDYFVLLLTSKLCSLKVKKWRLLVGAIAASLTSLKIFAPELSLMFEILVSVTISLLIVIVTFGFINKIRFFKAVLIFFFSSAALAGGAMALWSIFKINGLVIRNGTVFYNISPVILVLSITVVYIITTIVSKIIFKKKINSDYMITLKLNNRSVTINGFVDSGNMLRDTFTDTPVIIVSYERVKNLFCEKLDKIFAKQNFEMGFYDDILKSGYSGRFRVIPFESLSDSGVLAAIVLDNALLHIGEEKIKIEQIIMAVTHKKLMGGEYDALLSPEIITA